MMNWAPGEKERRAKQLVKTAQDASRDAVFPRVMVLAELVFDCVPKAGSVNDQRLTIAGAMMELVQELAVAKAAEIDQARRGERQAMAIEVRGAVDELAKRICK